MTKQEWRDLAEARLIDAGILLQGQRWAAVYYLAGVLDGTNSANWLVWRGSTPPVTLTALRTLPLARTGLR